MLTEDETRHYLDSCIRHWRERRDDPALHNGESIHPMAAIAPAYIDAFQCARDAILGECLPREEG